MLSIESRLLLCTAGGPDTDDRIRGLLGERIDWRKLVSASLVEGAQPVLWRRIRNAAADRVPASTVESLRRIERTADFRLAYLGRRLVEALEVLSGGGVPVLLLKGAALGHTVYASVSDRPMADVDLLVEPDRADEARSLLLAAGWAQRYGPQFDEWYATMHHLPPLVDTRAPGLEVGLDLHVDLFSRERNPFALSAAELWRDARPVAGLPRGTLAPSEVHQLLHCCLHYAWSHQLSGAAWRTYRDAAAVCSKGSLDWDAFVDAAGRSRGTACCYWTLRLARSLAHAPVPEGVLRRLRPDRPEWILGLLERHFAHEAVRAEQICPSNRLREAIWTAAVHPRGEARAPNAGRPWHLLRRPRAEDDLPDASDRRRPALSIRAWVRYLRSVL